MTARWPLPSTRAVRTHACLEPPTCFVDCRSGDRHKEAVARFVRNNREKKRHEEIEKAQVEKEMR
eukprot:230886-Hanusia_phi.AAC.1